MYSTPLGAKIIILKKYNIPNETRTNSIPKPKSKCKPLRQLYNNIVYTKI